MGVIEESLAFVIKRYTQDLWTLEKIAQELGVTREGVRLALRGVGIDTSRKSAGKVMVRCEWCKEEFEIGRARARNKMLTGGKCFCGKECEMTWRRHKGGYDE